MIIKQSPEDFIVEEIPLKDWDDAGQYAVFKVKKTNLNTEYAVNIISQRFHIQANNIKYSGTKDRHAITTQYISIPSNMINVHKCQLSEDNLVVEHVGYCEEPLSLGTLQGNRFIITVREIAKKELSAMNSRCSDKFIVPNYFDEQRFSTHNVNIGISILKKEYAKAVELLLSDPYYDNTLRPRFEAFPNDHVGMLRHVPKKTLLIFIHAVQSYIYNEALYRALKEHAEGKNIKYYTVDYSLGKLLFYENSAEYEGLIDSLELIGFDSQTMSHHTRQILDDLGLNTRDFIVRAIPELSVDGASRECFIGVKNLECRALSEHAILEFELPKGAYATIVVKGLFNP